MSKFVKPGITLKTGKEKAIKNYHQWIFSGAVHLLDNEVENGDIAPVFESNGTLLGSAYINRESSIIGRMVAFGAIDPMVEIKSNIIASINLRKVLFAGTDTNAYRLINAEGDNLPGLVVDKYGDVLVIQIATLGMEKLKNYIVEVLRDEVRPEAIYEKSNLPVRAEEGMGNFEGVVHGNVPERILVSENGLKLFVDVKSGQKTGFFIDQRGMRNLVRAYAKNRKLLNCFSYSGGFSIAGLAGGAESAESVDISGPIIALAEENARLNNFGNKHKAITADVFQYLREMPTEAFDFIVLDPPAFAKRKTDVVSACRGYKDINRLALQKIPAGGLILTSSCSHFVDEKLFQQVVFQASKEAGRKVKIISRHLLAPDHPINIYHPEGEYLKSLFLYVEGACEAGGGKIQDR